jgi:hypothetical protein
MDQGMNHNQEIAAGAGVVCTFVKDSLRQSTASLVSAVVEKEC